MCQILFCELSIISLLFDIKSTTPHVWSFNNIFFYRKLKFQCSEETKKTAVLKVTVCCSRSQGCCCLWTEAKWSQPQSLRGHWTPAGSCCVSPGGFVKGNIWEPVTQSLLNEVEHDHTPPVTQCVSIGCWELSGAWMWLLSRVYTIKTPQTPPSSLTLVGWLSAHKRERLPEPLQHFLLGFPAGSDELHRSWVPSPAPPAPPPPPHLPCRRLSPT